ncbi:type VI secretion protein TagU [Pseudomonas rhodesiae]|uniref:type VI secretion protein TagU n=1 Tax=Pseudomonas rhodesiae TaxID=76760 RepID=UPI003D6D7B54
MTPIKDVLSDRVPEFSGRNLMLLRPWHAWGLVLCLLSGCNANYVFDDADYRPLGEPQTTRRGQ